MCKIKIREFTQKFSKQKQKIKKQYFSKLEQDLIVINKKVDEEPTEKNIQELRRIKINLEKLYKDKCRGIFVRSREKWIEEGEKSTKYFLNLETQNAKKKEISAVLKNDKVIVDDKGILEEIPLYYINLYHSEKKSNPNEYLQNLNFVTLEENDSLSCEGILTEKESFEALLSMHNNKSPGSDGLSTEFYKTFWVHIKDLMLDSLNEGYRTGKLSDSQKHSVLTLLFKKGDKRNLDNWRPISLLNIDYKIATRALAKRLQNVIPELISFDQMGFIKKRSASENIRLVQDLLDFCSHENLPSIFLFLDFKKAFDNVDHNFLFEILKRYNFGKSFIQWIKTIYNHADCKVLNNGWLSKTLSISKGVRQGCPLSALLFILVVEILAMKIRKNKKIKGICLPECEHSNVKEIKISPLADDTTLFVDSLQSGNEAMKEVEALACN